MTDPFEYIDILDGGMGRELERVGAPFKQPEWSALSLMQSPEKVAQVHRHFLDAGAQIITTNAYAIVPFHIGDDAFQGQSLSLAQRAARIARQEIDAFVTEQEAQEKNTPLLAGCIPPAFGSYRPDLFDKSQVENILRPLITGQQDDVDFWLIETVSSIEEANAVVSILREYSTLPIWLSYSLANRHSDSETPKLRSEEPLAHIAATLDGVDAVLFNCSQPEEMEDAIAMTRKMNSGIRIGAYANSFSERNRQHEANALLSSLRNDVTPEQYLHYAKTWVSAGASIVGGCCGIGPEHIEALWDYFKNPSFPLPRKKKAESPRIL